MKLNRILSKAWAWLPPETWLETYATIITLLLAFLAVVFLLNHLKGPLP